MITISTHWIRKDGKGKWQIYRRIDDNSPFYTNNASNMITHNAITDAYRIASYAMNLYWCDAVRITKDGEILLEAKKEAQI